MLINAKYLNSDQLASYVAALEDGVRESRSSHLSKDTSKKGGFDAKFAHGELGATRVDDETISIKDHDHARLKRLLSVAETRPDELGWVDVLQPDADLSGARIGNLIKWECDVYIPEMIKALQSNGGMAKAVRMVQDLAPAAEAMGLDMAGLPSQAELGAISSLTERMEVAPILIGDDEDTEWKIVGSLNTKWIRDLDELEDRCIVIGKVRKVIPEGRWHLLASLPGMNLISRDERRKKERTGPTNDGEKSQYVEGPAVVVDFLAIYS